MWLSPPRLGGTPPSLRPSLHTQHTAASGTLASASHPEPSHPQLCPTLRPRSLSEAPHTAAQHAAVWLRHTCISHLTEQPATPRRPLAPPCPPRRGLRLRPSAALARPHLRFGEQPSDEGRRVACDERICIGDDGVGASAQQRQDQLALPES
eukprot:scaffold18474_cov107-Isochrysis_galbana.AAC.1